MRVPRYGGKDRTNMVVTTGLEVLLGNPPDVVRGQRIGLLTNPAAVDGELRLALDRLAAESLGGQAAGEAGRANTGRWRVVRLFGPEHGVRGDYVAGGPVPDTVDPITGLPVSSLYGAERAPTAAMLADVDVVVVDLPDAGVRFYTAIYLRHCLIAGATHGRRQVLDRPNRLAASW
jgi:uncharacterized protein YbbC (DUF1343 family)